MAHLFYRKLQDHFALWRNEVLFMKQNQIDCRGKVKYSEILSFLHILYMSIITCSYGFRHQIDVASHLSYAYCLNPQNKNFNFNLGFPSPP